MTAASALIAPCTIAEASQYDRFRAAELESLAAKPVDLDEMIEVLLAVRQREEASAHLAETVYGHGFHPAIVRRCAGLGRTAEFLGLLHPHRDEVRAIIQAKPKPQRRRA